MYIGVIRKDLFSASLYELDKRSKQWLDNIFSLIRLCSETRTNYVIKDVNIVHRGVK